MAGKPSSNDIAWDDEGLGFDSRAGPIGLDVAKGSQVLRRFFGFVLPRLCTAEMNPASGKRFGVIPPTGAYPGGRGPPQQNFRGVKVIYV